EATVVSEQQQAFGVEVEPADADQAWQLLWQRAEDGGTALRVGAGGDKPARLVKQEQPCPLARGQWFSVDNDTVLRRHVERGRKNCRAIDGDAASRDPGLGLAARAQAGARNHLGNPFGGFCKRLCDLGRRTRQRGLQPLATEFAAPVSRAAGSMFA